MLKSLLLVIAVCIDSFAAAIGIGGAGIRLGIFNLFQNFFRNILSRSAKKGNPAMMFFDGASADTDGSKSISVKEALVLSAALSADSLVTGIGAGLDSISLPALSVFAFGLGFASIFCSEKMGRRRVWCLWLMDSKQGNRIFQYCIIFRQACFCSL